jgi:hypothetical protein
VEPVIERDRLDGSARGFVVRVDREPLGLLLLRQLFGLELRRGLGRLALAGADFLSFLGACFRRNFRRGFRGDGLRRLGQRRVGAAATAQGERRTERTEPDD